LGKAPNPTAQIKLFGLIEGDASSLLLCGRPLVYFHHTERAGVVSSPFWVVVVLTNAEPGNETYYYA